MLIQKYNPLWPKQFRTIKSILLKTCVGLDLKIEHVGSTAVPELAAKAIIDIDIVLPRGFEFDVLKSRLERIGYFHNGDQGIPGREAFKRIDSNKKHEVLDEIEHHLYACPFDSAELQRHLLFRDYLRINEKARAAYQALKYEIANETNQDRKAYARLKEEKARPLILKIIDKAKADGRLDCH